MRDNKELTSTARLKKRRLRKSRLAFVLTFLVALSSIIALAVTVPRVDEYSVEGTTNLSKQRILELSGIADNQHALLYDFEAVKAGISNDPYFDVQSVSYLFPSTVKIVVKERKPDAVVRYWSEDILISRDGTVLEIGPAGSFEGVLRLLGVSMTSFAVGDKLGVSDSYQMMVTEKVLDVLYSDNFVDDYALVHVGNPVDVKLLSHNGITVRIGQISDTDQKLFRSEKLLRSTLRDNEGGILDASTASLTYRASANGGIEIPSELEDGSLSSTDQYYDSSELVGSDIWNLSESGEEQTPEYAQPAEQESDVVTAPVEPATRDLPQESGSTSEPQNEQTSEPVELPEVSGNDEQSDDNSLDLPEIGE